MIYRKDAQKWHRHGAFLLIRDLAPRGAVEQSPLNKCGYTGHNQKQLQGTWYLMKEAKTCRIQNRAKERSTTVGVQEKKTKQESQLYWKLQQRGEKVKDCGIGSMQQKKPNVSTAHLRPA